jgi:hypothetical protein
MAQLNDITSEQQEALYLYAHEKGRSWKQQLLEDWHQSTYCWTRPEQSCFLQQLRNERGPSWLKQLRLPPRNSIKCFVGNSSSVILGGCSKAGDLI